MNPTAGQTFSIAALVGAIADRQRLSTSLREDVVMQFCRDSPELLALMSRRAPHAVIIDLDSVRDSASRSIIRNIRTRYPAIAVLLYLSLTHQDVRDLAPIAADIKPHAAVLRELDDVGSVAVDAIAVARGMSTAARIVELIERSTPTSLRPLLAFVAHNSNRPMSVREVAQYSGVSTRTLFQRCRAAGLPSVALLIRWMRLLHVAGMLDVRDITVVHVADRLRFASASTLRDMLKQFTGLTPRQLQDAGGLTYLLGVVEAEVLRRYSGDERTIATSAATG